jgi:hypothetical protein
MTYTEWGKWIMYYSDWFAPNVFYSKVKYFESNSKKQTKQKWINMLWRASMKEQLSCGLWDRTWIYFKTFSCMEPRQTKSPSCSDRSFIYIKRLMYWTCGYHEHRRRVRKFCCKQLPIIFAISAISPSCRIAQLEKLIFTQPDTGKSLYILSMHSSFV